MSSWSCTVTYSNQVNPEYASGLWAISRCEADVETGVIKDIPRREITDRLWYRPDLRKKAKPYSRELWLGSKPPSCNRCLEPCKDVVRVMEKQIGERVYCVDCRRDIDMTPDIIATYFDFTRRVRVTIFGFDNIVSNILYLANSDEQESLQQLVLSLLMNWKAGKLNV